MHDLVIFLNLIKFKVILSIIKNSIYDLRMVLEGKA